MSKYSGYIGYSQEVSNPTTGITEVSIVRHKVRGDLLTNRYSTHSRNQIIDGMLLPIKVSIVMDSKLKGKYYDIVYLEYEGQLWKVENIDLTRRPRCIITIGGVYNVQIENKQA